MIFRWFAVAACLGLTACNTTGSTGNLTSSYVGKNSDEFFIKNGPADSSQRLNNGDIVYFWNGHEKGSTVYEFQTCNIVIHASASGRIKSIDIKKDTVGNWTLSQCGETVR